jgi:two-component system OmpR family sensor kinase
VSRRAPRIAWRIALLSGMAAAVTALLSSLVPLVVLAISLDGSDGRSALLLVDSVKKGFERVRRTEPDVEKAARALFDEAAFADVTAEVWAASLLLAARGPGPLIGPAGEPPDRSARREGERIVVRDAGPDGLGISVAVPRSFSATVRRQMNLAFLVSALPVSILAGLVTSRWTHRALSPLSTLAVEVAARTPTLAWTPLVAPSADEEIVRLTDAFNATGGRLVAALSGERAFSAQASHALRTPLTRLAAHTSGDRGPVGRSIRTLQRLVDGLLLIVRRETSLHEHGFSVNIADVARQVASESDFPARLVVRAADEVFVRGDEDLLVAAVEHLVDNALKYAPAGSDIELSVREHEGLVMVAVKDEGPGLDDDERERVFEPFVRGRQAGAVDGSGLGLTLVRRIAEGHGGSVRAEKDGRGTRFEIRLPGWKPL